jgi:TPR repeat protein
MMNLCGQLFSRVARTRLFLLLSLCFGVACYAQRPNLKATKAKAAKGDRDAQYRFGVMHADGQGATNDFVQAAKWFRLAADQGLAIAQNNLGGLYFTGRGVPQDFQEAAKWYQKAASQGFIPAQMFLGWMYSTGNGVEQNQKEGLKWYRMAADQGDNEAQYNVGMLVLNSGTSKPDYVESYKWFNLAAAQGNTNAIRYRAQMIVSMTPDEIKKGQRLSSQFKPKKKNARSTNPTNQPALKKP